MDIETRFEPWIGLLETHTARWRRIQHPETGRECDGIVFIGSLDVTRTLRDHDLQELRRVREMMDLVRLLALADPTEFTELMELQESHWSATSQQHEFMDAIERGVPLVLKFQLELEGDVMSDLTPWLTDFFSDEFASDEADFIQERQRLVELLSESQWEHLQNCPAQVSLDVLSSELEDSVLIVDTEDFFTDLTTFANEMQRIDGKSTMSASKSFLPIALDRIKLSLRDVWITPGIIAAATALVASGVPVKLCQINIDPRFVHCSEAELCRFLDTLMTVKSKLQVLIGQPRQSDDRTIDSRDQDRSHLLGIIFHAINRLPNLHKLDVTQLLRMLVAPRNRRLAFQELMLPVFTRSTPVPIFSLGLMSLSQEDLECFHTIANDWRRLNTGKLLRVKCLQFGMGGVSSSVADELATVVDDAEEVLFFTLRRDPKVPSSLARSVLRYPSLKALNARNCEIESMDIFDPLIIDAELPVKPVLRSLQLEWFVLQDEMSMQRFLRRLQDSSHPLSKTLEWLSLRGEVDLPDTYKLDADDSQALVDSLRVNRILADVSVVLAPIHDEDGHPDHARTRGQVEALQPTCGMCVPGPKYRQSKAHKARIRAFLSVLKSDLPAIPEACRCLDAGVLSTIFDFSAPHRTRSIRVQSFLAT